jgi:hypothetical protein
LVFWILIWIVFWISPRETSWRSGLWNCM